MRIAHRDGWSIRDIAGHFGYPRSTVHDFLCKPVPSQPDFNCEIVTPVHLTPNSEPTRIRDGDAAYCVVSHLTGIEDHPKLQKPRVKPKKESKHKFKPKIKKKAKG